MPTNTFSSSALGGSLQNMSYHYQFDSIGNLSSREDHVNQAKEVFQYDKLNRLTDTITTYKANDQDLSITATNSYDGHGNLRSKDSFTYLYGLEGATPGSEHQVTQLNQDGASQDTLEYDANGNVTYAGKQRTIQWNTFNKPSKFTKIEDTGYEQVASFLYNTSHERMVQITPNTATWYAAGGLFEHYKHYRTDVETAKYFLMINGQKVGYITQDAGDDGGGVVVGQRIAGDAGESGANQQRVANRVGYNLKTYYLLNDHLGSPQALLDEGGEVLENMSFGAWGERRPASFDPDGLMTPALFLLSDYSLTHGFTGHEQDDAFGFINMKGRIYDAALGRFMSADPFVQAPNNTQSYNRYSYVLNNPLSYTDPSGYLFSGLKKFLRKHGRTIMAIGVGIVTGGIGAAAFGGGFAGAIAGGAIGGFSGTLAATGSLEAAVTAGILGALSGGLAWQIGHGAIGASFGKVGTTSRTVGAYIAHGVSQGTISVLQGGKFAAGFVGAMAGHASGHLTKGIQGFSVGAKIARTMIAAVVGGTASQITGGKFGNGAVSAAFTHLFNNEGGVGELVDALKRRNDLTGQVLDGASQFASTMKAGGRHALRNYKISYFGSSDERARLLHVHQLTGNVLALAAYNPSALVDIFSLDGLMDNTVQFATGVGVNLLTKTPAASGLQFFAVSDLIYTNYNVMARPIEYFHSRLNPLESMGLDFDL